MLCNVSLWLKTCHTNSFHGILRLAKSSKNLWYVWMTQPRNHLKHLLMTPDTPATFFWFQRLIFSRHILFIHFSESEDTLACDYVWCLFLLLHFLHLFCYLSWYREYILFLRGKTCTCLLYLSQISILRLLKIQGLWPRKYGRSTVIVWCKF